jgi:hypothetical protein
VKRLTFVFLMALTMATTGVQAQQPSPQAGETKAAAADGAKTAQPALTEVQRLQIANLSKQLELNQTQIKAAQLEFDRAAQTLSQMVQALQVPGYDLNLQTLEYAKKPDVAKSGDPKK